MTKRALPLRTIAKAVFCMLLGMLFHAPSYSSSLNAWTTPALKSANATESLILDLFDTGKRLVAVGEQGHILYSEDGGNDWIQASVPVRVTLTAVHFVGPDKGWAVGHAGVVLHSRDGGLTWSKQLDGVRVNEIVLADSRAYLDGMATESSEDRELAEFSLDDALAFKAEGPSRPFLGVWFDSEHVGFVVGAYGLILRTVDGGKSWQSWSQNIDNPDGMHYYAIHKFGSSHVMVGEAGTIYRSGGSDDKWWSLDSPYEGTFMGVAGSKSGQRVVAFGLRGNAFISTDLGDSWQTLQTGIDSTLEGAVITQAGELLLVGHAGAVLSSQGGEASLAPLWRDPKRPAHADILETADGALILAGSHGIKRIDLSERNAVEGLWEIQEARQ